MSKGNLTLGESKTKDDLTLENKGMNPTWDTATGTWEEQTSDWDTVKGSLTKESKSLDDLVLESK